MSRLTRKVSFPISFTPLTYAIGKKNKLAIRGDLLTIIRNKRCIRMENLALIFAIWNRSIIAIYFTVFLNN